jgi:hypothetical protein
LGCSFSINGDNFSGAKQNIKETIDFIFKRAVGELYYFTNSPQLKQAVSIGKSRLVIIACGSVALMNEE